MPQDRLEEARFDHVGETGELVFSSGGRLFAVTVDDALERAILEAKQLASEHRQSQRMPRQQTALPISQIQSLIRAGADPTRVAERYELSAALVRRFSAAVETEKQYAIEQFLSVPAPKESKVRTLSELVERTLASVNIGMESVAWKATRRGLEPWHIIAQFSTAGRTAKAEWTWDMHDNSVVSLNNTARKLLGEQNSNASADVSSDTRAPALPGNSVRSARIERAVSAWNTPEPTLPAARPETRRPAPSNIELHLAAAMPNPTDGTETNEQPQQYPGGLSQPDIMQTLAEISDEDDARGSARISPSSAATENPDAADASDAPSTTPASETQEQTSAAGKAAKRKSGRSAVPSWDEILFGD
ncbi:hypothetical protein BLEM_0077 [Bifidobacterium lemurum]|uniref:DUF3071 domain-containing protein n=1 Tax=Bifidobacterium lemurum TaxID=1603886 RepID=A0A261FW02_9BIFI|nr:septation protein SepH [Bifidobacterium lemurum]OZG63374.1 hypothetical protein BLEM_0077 [Bifidobacterium lemurum]QOL34282.1 DUF3071 domain-containing protein [Bifidobacterium lemurum]